MRLSGGGEVPVLPLVLELYDISVVSAGIDPTRPRCLPRVNTSAPTSRFPHTLHQCLSPNRTPPPYAPATVPAQNRSPLPVRGKRGERDPLKGWARKDTALPDTFSIEQPLVDVTGFCLQFAQVFQAAVAT